MVRASPTFEKENMRKVFDVLLTNADYTEKEIAEKTGLSRQTVSKLKDKLVEKGVVWGYTVAGDYSRDPINLRFFILGLKFKRFFGEMPDRIIEARDVLPSRGKRLGARFLYVGFLQGQLGFDCLCFFLAPDEKIARRVVREMFEPFKDIIEGIKLSEEILTFRHFLLNPNLKEDISEKYHYKI